MMPLLSTTLFLPLFGALLLWLLPAQRARVLVALVQLATLLLASTAFFVFDPHAGFQFVERQVWIASLNVHYQLGIDGISVLFLPSTALLFLGTLIVQWQHAQDDNPRLYYSLLLALQTCTLGIFCALDTLLFFVFWELSLIPLYFLLARWGVSARRVQVAARYVLIMLASGVALLLAFLWMAVQQPAAGFDLLHLLTVDWSHGTQMAVFLLCLLGFGVKVPLVPLHTWLPQFALAAPGSLTALLLGLKLGAYGLIRFALPLAPSIAPEMHWLLAGLGTVALLYGAVGMLGQSNLRVGLAYAGISHVGLAVLGLASFTAQGVFGAVSLLLSFCVASGGGLLLLECLRQRVGSTDIRSLGGVAGSMPLLASGVLVCGLAGVGMPGTSSFPGEFLLVLAALQSHTGAGMAALFALSIAAGGFLHLYRQAFFGPVSQQRVAEAHDLQPREWVLLVVLICMVVGIGVYPEPWMEIIRPTAEAWVAGMHR